MHRDEALAVMVARRPLGELLETVQLVRGGAPLHFLLAALVDRAGRRPRRRRAPSRRSGCCVAIVGGRAARPRAGRPGRAASRRPGSSRSRPVALYYGDFARMYSLFLAFSALALWCLVRALDDGGARWWAGTAVAARR